MKLLEEPPEHLTIILCTTNSLGDAKIPETVISRCELYPFVKLESKLMIEKLKHIAQAEQVSVNEDWLNWVVSFSGGNVRTAECELGKRLCLEGV